MRPFLDSEHGPIHLFHDQRITLPEAFDDEYFRHIQWAHFAAGGAGGGMRWPNRHPHQLTPGMRSAQSALARFLPLIDWQHFGRRNLNDELGSTQPGLALFGSGDEDQAVVWLLRKDSLAPDGTLRQDVAPVQTELTVPGLRRGAYCVTMWNTAQGAATGATSLQHWGGNDFCISLPPFVTDLAVAVQRCEL